MLAARPWALLLLVAASPGLLVSCRDPRPAAVQTSAPLADPLARARAAVRRGDHAAAATLLREAMAGAPDSLEPHYLLAVSASHLDQLDEAGREFEWVVAHGEPGSAEVTIAREWLAARVPAPSAPAEAPAGAVPAQRPDLASISGAATDTSGPRPRLLLLLKGLRGSATQDEYRTQRTDRQGHFQFADLVPGDYVLTNAVAGPAVWRLRVSVARGERLTLDLSPSNDTSVRDDAPEMTR